MLCLKYIKIVMVNFHCSLQTIKQWLYNLVKTILRRFRWAFLLAGFVALAMAGISWTLETSSNYWFWHRYCNFTHTLSSISLFLCILWLMFALLKWLQLLACYNIHIFFLLPLFKSKYCRWCWESATGKWKLWTYSSGFISKR